MTRVGELGTTLVAQPCQPNATAILSEAAISTVLPTEWNCNHIRSSHKHSLANRMQLQPYQKQISTQPCQPNGTAAISEAAINTALPSTAPSDIQVTGSYKHNKDQFLTAPREKTPPVIIHDHFQGDMTI
jgi:hypothetical protein